MAALETELEAVLFFKGEPESKKRLAKLLDVSEGELEAAATNLRTSLGTHGIRLLSVGDQLELVTAPETSEAVTKARKEELVRDLGKAGADTLAIILYRGEVTRADIEYVRGVNCSFILRNLLIRGLIERIPNPKNARSVLYRPSPDLLKHLGVTDVTELPEYDAVQKELADFEARRQDEAGQDASNHESAERVESSQSI